MKILTCNARKPSVLMNSICSEKSNTCMARWTSSHAFIVSVVENNLRNPQNLNLFYINEEEVVHVEHFYGVDY